MRHNEEGMERYRGDLVSLVALRWNARLVIWENFNARVNAELPVWEVWTRKDE